MQNQSVIMTEVRRPEVVKLEYENEQFGNLEEITSKTTGAGAANMAKVTLWGADVAHRHNQAEETYFCVAGEGEILIGEEIWEFNAGTRVIIKPGTAHAARPTRGCRELVFYCVSAPPFDPTDAINDPRGRNW
jgi:mannose-6-phosphate isomerase-like protein (cupin superfamily)